MRHEVNIGHNIDEVRQTDRGGWKNPTTYLMVEDIYVNQVIRDLQSAIADLERIKR